MFEAMPLFVILIGNIPLGPGFPNQHRPSGKPSFFVVDFVLLLASPPLQPPICAFPGDTVTDRIVGTVVSERLTLAAVPAPGGAGVLPQPATAAPSTTTATAISHLTLRASIASPSLELRSIRSHSVNLDPDAEPACDNRSSGD